MAALVKAIVFVRNLIASGIAFLIRPIMHELIYKLNRLNQLNLSTAALHQKTFLPYKGIYEGRDVVIVACGPSLNRYVAIPNAIHIGVNKAFQKSDLPLDYLFVFDVSRFSREEIDRLNSYGGRACTKFYGFTNELTMDNDWTLSETDCANAEAKRFRADSIYNYGPCGHDFFFDISTQPLTDYGSIIFPAIQFALWTNPRRIYLVGCDCTTGGHFYEKKKQMTTHPLLYKGYIALKRFAASYYPGTEIISINPVALKGVFRDVTQGGS